MHVLNTASSGAACSGAAYSGAITFAYIRTKWTILL